MAKYIDVQKADMVIQTELGVYDTTDLKEMLSFFPSEDVAPIKHARWICDDYMDLEIVCSYCGADNNRKTRYCPYCGAKMDEKRLIWQYSL